MICLVSEYGPVSDGSIPVSDGRIPAYVAISSYFVDI